MALNILTGSKLVIKRIASKETKNPRVPVDGDALVAEVRFRRRARDATLSRLFLFRTRRVPRRLAPPRAPRALRVRRT